jgi:hypothetical protein
MATSNADFYRAQFANMNNEDRQRKNALQDDFTKSQYDNLNASLANIQNNPSLSPEDKANADQHHSAAAVEDHDAGNGQGSPSEDDGPVRDYRYFRAAVSSSRTAVDSECST